jgi:hypothetical protein
VNHAYVRLYQNSPSDYGLKLEKTVDKSILSGPQWKCSADSTAGWEGLEFDDKSWQSARKTGLPDSITVSGFPDKAPTPMWVAPTGADSAAAPAAAKQGFFRRVFYMTEPPQKAQLFVVAAADCRVYLNGQALDKPALAEGAWTRAVHWDLAGKLRQGKNAIAIRVVSATASACGLLPLLALTVTAYDYPPVFPGTQEPLDKQVVAEANWVFPFVKNFSPEPIAASNATN